jgi:hypothetical protein
VEAQRKTLDDQKLVEIMFPSHGFAITALHQSGDMRIMNNIIWLSAMLLFSYTDTCLVLFVL